MGIGDYWDGFDEGVDAAIVRRPHAATIERVARKVQRWFPRTQIYLETRRREQGRPGTLARWPDIQFVNPERHRATHIEVDTRAAGMAQHIRDHLANSSGRRGVFLQINPRTGAIVRKVIYAAGARQPMVDQRGSATAPVPLNRHDVFDAWDD